MQDTEPLEDTFGLDAAEAAWEGSAGGTMAEDAPDDFEDLEAAEDEEDTVMLGGGGFTPEEIASAQRRFDEAWVRDTGLG